MPYFPDLTPYRYFGGERRPLVNVGWLARGHDFPTGPIDERFVDGLVRCALHPVRLAMGLHRCDLCADGPRDIEAYGRRVPLGNGEIRAAWNGVEYAAPTLVVHYVSEHGYAPPDGFLRAVLARAGRITPLTTEEVAALRALDHSAQIARARALIEPFAACSPYEWPKHALQQLPDEGWVEQVPEEVADDDALGVLLDDLAWLHENEASRTALLAGIVEKARELSAREKP